MASVWPVRNEVTTTFFQLLSGNWISWMTLELISGDTDLHHILIQPTYNVTHKGRVTHICVGKLTIINSDNGLSPDLVVTYISEILIKFHAIQSKKKYFKMLSVKLRPFCLGLNELTLLGILSWLVKVHHIRGSLVLTGRLFHFPQCPKGLAFNGNAHGRLYQSMIQWRFMIRLMGWFSVSSYWIACKQDIDAD